MPILYDVYQIINKNNAISREDGELLYNEILIAINNDLKIAIDFKNIHKYSKDFTDTSIQRLIHHLSPNKFKSYVEIRNLTK